MRKFIVDIITFQSKTVALKLLYTQSNECALFVVLLRLCLLILPTIQHVHTVSTACSLVKDLIAFCSSTDNHSRSGALEVNTGFSNNPELLESRSKTAATRPQEFESEDPVLAIEHRVLDTIEFERERIERAVHGTSQQLTLGLLQRELASLKNKVVMEENTLIWCSMVNKLREIERRK